MQAYRVDLLIHHGFVLWDSAWYGGSFPLSYTVLFPVVGALIGLSGAAVLSAVAASWCFDRIVRRVTGRRSLGCWYFAVSTLLAVTIGQLPYLAGEALALGAVMALLHNRARLGLTLGALSALFSPLAAAFLILACGVWAVHDRSRRRPLMLTVATTGAMVIGIGALFPGAGPFPFHWAGFVIVELLCLLVLSPLVPSPPAVRLAAGVYGVATLASFVVPNPLGGNATRLAESVGIPLVACLVTATVPGAVAKRRRPSERRTLTVRPTLALGALLPFVVWQWAPGTSLVGPASSTPANTAAFYQPLLHELSSQDHGRPVRVEVVPTRDHWESADVAPYVSLARGWERQLDVEDNPIFYVTGALTAPSYSSWLTGNGVSYVAVADTPLDYAGQAEADLLRARAPGDLRLVWHTSSWHLWRVDDSPGLVTGGARLISVAPDRLVVDVARPGGFLLRVRYISYWHLTAGTACVQPAPGGWTEVHAAAGRVQLHVALLGPNPAACASR